MARIRKCGGYRELASFKLATIVYDATYWFCEKFVDSRSRTVDQMVQAARSGRQNIAEGSLAGGSSSQTELRLTNVARASQEELLLDFEDYLRHRRLLQWAPDSPEALAVRKAHKTYAPRAVPGDNIRETAGERFSRQQREHEQQWQTYSPWLEHAEPAVRANALICLINQLNYLLDQQVESLEQQFVNDGGYSENLAAERLKARRGKKGPDRKPEDFPDCPECGSEMVLRTVRKGRNEGKNFFGCSRFPDCKGALDI